MNKRSHVTARQMLFALGFLLAFLSMTIFLFSFQRDEKRFTNITTELFAGEMKANTLNMHYTIAHPENFGIYDYKPALGIYDPGQELQGQAGLENTLAALNAIHKENLSPGDARLWQLMNRSLENSLALGSFSYYGEPLSPSSGTQTQLPILLAEYTFRTRQDVEDYLGLLDQTDEYLASLLVYEQEKAAAGLLMPSSFLQEVRAQCDSVITADALESGTHFLQTTFRERIAALVQEGIVTAKEAESYQALNERLLRTVVLPAYTSLGDGLLLLEDDSILPSGLATLPQGKAYYEKLMISKTGSYRPIDEIQKLLTAQFTREYDAVKEIVAQHPDLVSSYGAPPAFPLKSAALMLADLQQRMGKDFPAIPGGTVNAAVKALSPSLEPYCAPAFYLTSPLDDTESNTIYINQAKTPDGLDLYTTLAHEGYPGHLYQNAYHNRTCQEQEERPARQLLWYGGYQEGWALYGEFLSYDYAAELLEEEGLETAALWARLERHNRSLQLCLYSLIDIMVHYEGASYSHIATALEGFGITDSDSIKSIYHVIVQEPCNYLKYYLGYLEILELKARAEELWDADYSDYRFHCFYLDCGPCDFLTLGELLEETPSGAP